MSVVEEYFKIIEYYRQKYGDRTVLLMQIGTFYEIYAINDDPLCELLSDLLNIRLTLKNSHSLDTAGTTRNPFMVGIPCASYENHKRVLLANNYTIIKYDQAKNKTTRELAEVASPLTTEEFNYKVDFKSTNSIYSIYIECINIKQKIENSTIIIGISSIDVITGKTKIQEFYTDTVDSRLPINETYRILTSDKPKELQIYVKYPNTVTIDIMNNFEKFLFEALELGTFPIFNMTSQIPLDYYNQKYQEQFLNKMYRPTVVTTEHQNLKIYLTKGGILDIFTELGIERLTYGVISFIALMQYCFEHNQNLISKVKRPNVIMDTSTSLNLTYNAVIQLNLVNSNSMKINYRIGKKKAFDTLLSVLDNTNTVMGGRVLRNRLLNPSTNIELLRNRYNLIGFLMDKKDLVQGITNSLKQLYDLERLNLKLSKGTIKPKEFYNLFISYKTVIELINLILPYVGNSPLLNILPTRDELIKFNNMISSVFTVFDLEILQECNAEDNSFNCLNSPILNSVNTEIDQYQNYLNQCQNQMVLICEHLESAMGMAPGSCIEVGSFSKKVKKGKSILDDEDETIINMKDLGIYLTSAKATKLKGNLAAVDTNFCGQIRIESKNSKYKVKSDIIDSLCTYILEARNKIGTLTFNYYNEYIKMLDENYDSGNIINFIIELDIATSNTIISSKYGYHKPEIVVTDDKSSFIQVTNLRHPLVERIINTEYIPNDISLQNNGILLYGCNSTGKTVLTTSVALAIIMAQMGSWTAGEIKYYPYSKIITRLSGQDDLLKGHSSFIVEMLELRTILRNADMNSLILGDELCRGTENLSGSALTISSIEFLISKKASFMFSTHLHGIEESPRIKKVIFDGKLKVNHLNTTYDVEKEELIFNRKLQDGSGDSIYGIEVAKSLDIDPDFITNASNIRKELLNESKEFLSSKKSPYNSNIRMHECLLCKKQIDLNNHHIREQSLADDNGLISHIPKDAEYNILIICSDCHKKIHQTGVQPIIEQSTTGLIIKFIK
jgi:DNA mismatch repair protein MutS